MPRRGQSGGKGRSSAGRRAKVVAGVVLGGLLALCLVGVGYEVRSHRAEIRQFFSNPPPPDPALVDRAIEEAYAAIAPTKIATSQVKIGSRDVRQDRLLLPMAGSLLRANADVTAAVERAGGEVAYGIESVDDKGRKTGVTLGISVRKNLVREIKIERSTR